jgi:AcrR family transcriptional regulator
MSKRELKKKQITAHREEQILQAALEVFSRKGYSAATINDIAKLANVATGTVYIYFLNKREIFISVIRKFIFNIPLLNLFEKLPKADFPVVLHNILQNRLSLTEGDNISQISSLMSEIQRDPELKTLFAEKLIRPLLSKMEEFYRTSTATKGFRHIEPSILVRAIGGLILGFIMLKVMEGDASPINRTPRDKVADELLNFVLYGLSNNENRSKLVQEIVA